MIIRYDPVNQIKYKVAHQSYFEAKNGQVLNNIEVFKEYCHVEPPELITISSQKYIFELFLAVRMALQNAFWKGF